MPNNCVLSRGTPIDTSIFGKSVAFDPNDRLLMGYDTTLCDFGTNDYTVEFFFSFLATPGADETFWALANGATSGNTPYFRIYFDATNRRVRVEEATSTRVSWQLTGATIALSLNRWYHTALVRKSNFIYLYLDGALQASGAWSAAHQSGMPMMLGGLQFGGNYVTPFAGLLSNVRVSRTAVYSSAFARPTNKLIALPSTTLLACANNDGIVDDSSYARPISLVNTPVLDPRNPFS